MSVSSGCEPEANGKDAPKLPVFTALKPAAGRVQPGSQTGTLLAPPVLIRRRISTNIHMLHACSLNTGSGAGAFEFCL